MRRALIAPVLALSLAGAPAAAQDSPPPAPDKNSASELARKAMEDLMLAIELMLRSIPQYEAPYVNERGDIIIRRKNPPREGTPAEPSDESGPTMDETRT